MGPPTGPGQHLICQKGHWARKIAGRTNLRRPISWTWFPAVGPPQSAAATCARQQFATCHQPWAEVGGIRGKPMGPLGHLVCPGFGDLSTWTHLESRGGTICAPTSSLVFSIGGLKSVQDRVGPIAPLFHRIVLHPELTSLPTFLQLRVRVTNLASMQRIFAAAANFSGPPHASRSAVCIARSGICRTTHTKPRFQGRD